MPIVLAFDLSLSSTGWALTADGRLVDTGLILSQGEGVGRLIVLRNKVMDLVDKHMPALVMFEDLAFAGYDTGHERAGLAYMVRAELHSDAFPWAVVSPASLKKFVVGQGGSKKNPVRKEHMLKAMLQHFGHDIDQNDIADAIGVAYVGMAAIGDWEPRTKAQREVIEKFIASNPTLKTLRQRSDANYVNEAELEW